MEIQLSTRFKAQWVLIILVVTLVIVFGSTIAFAAPTCNGPTCTSKISDKVLMVVATPLCKGSACNGKNPQTMGCNGDAKYGASIKNIFISTTKVGEVHNRSSVACQAQWERTYNTTSAKYAEGSIRWGGTNYNSGWQSVSSPGTITNAAVVYTSMYGATNGASAPSLVCGNLSTTGPIYAPSAPPSAVSGTYKTTKCQAN